MKMPQFAFVQKCPALTSTALPPPPLNVQLTLSGGKVNMSTAPYTVVSMVLVVTEVSLLHTWLPKFSRGWLSSSSGIHLFLVILKCTLARLGWCVCFFLFLLFLLFLWFLILWFPLLVWLQSDVASKQLINLTLKMTIARFVETSVTVNNNPFQDHTHLDDHFPPTLDPDIYFHLFQYSGSFKVTLSCSKSIS